MDFFFVVLEWFCTFAPVTSSTFAHLFPRGMQHNFPNDFPVGRSKYAIASLPHISPCGPRIGMPQRLSYHRQLQPAALGQPQTADTAHVGHRGSPFRHRYIARKHIGKRPVATTSCMTPHRPIECLQGTEVAGRGVSRYAPVGQPSCIATHQTGRNGPQQHIRTTQKR